jgi:DNA-binding transcriptional ArsR family regulator
MLHAELRALRLVKRAMAVLCLLLRLDKPVSGSEIADSLALSPKTVRRHLALLAEQELVCRQACGWVLTAAGRQLLLGEEGISTQARAPKSLKMPFKSTTSAFPQELINLTADVVARGEIFPSRANSKGRRKQMGEDLTLPAADFEANLQAMLSEGVGESFLVRQICQMAHVSPSYIRAQAERLRRERRFHPGLLIHVVRSRDPVPQVASAELDRRRYISGPYADLIQH